jgi:hypothetical protein
MLKYNMSLDGTRWEVCQIQSSFSLQCSSWNSVSVFKINLYAQIFIILWKICQSWWKLMLWKIVIFVSLFGTVTVTPSTTTLEIFSLFLITSCNTSAYSLHLPVLSTSLHCTGQNTDSLTDLLIDLLAYCIGWTLVDSTYSTAVCCTELDWVTYCISYSHFD